MKKSEIVCLMFYRLLVNRSLKRADFINETKINSLTFARYLSDIRALLKDKIPQYHVVYNRGSDTYYLKEDLL